MHGRKQGEMSFEMALKQGVLVETEGNVRPFKRFKKRRRRKGEMASTPCCVHGRKKPDLCLDGDFEKIDFVRGPKTTEHARTTLYRKRKDWVRRERGKRMGGERGPGMGSRKMERGLIARTSRWDEVVELKHTNRKHLYVRG